MRLAAGIIFYDDIKGLKRLLDSVYEHIDKAFCIDGKFKHYGSELDQELSKDGSRELVKSYNNTILLNCPNALEVDKRDRYFYLSDIYNMDYLIVLDTDEWIEGDWGEFKKNAEKIEEPVSSIKAYAKSIGGYTVYPRLFRNPKLTRYSFKHNAVFHNSQFVDLRQTFPTIEGITIHFNDDLRTKEHHEKSQQYKRWLMEYERIITNQPNKFSKD